jgi:DNA-binding MarR family transcriptional regulator
VHVPVEKSLLRLLVEAADAAEAILRDNFAGTPMHGVTRAQVTVFRELDAGGPATMSDLARTIGVTAQAMGECVRRLEGHGLVDVAPDPRDFRVRVVSISPLGRDLLGSVWEGVDHLETLLAAVIGNDGLGELKRSLAVIPGLRRTSETAPAGR